MGTRLKKSISMVLTVVLLLTSLPGTVTAQEIIPECKESKDGKHVESDVYEVGEEPTCQKEGWKKVQCELCKDWYRETIAKVNHNWDEGKITSEATCIKEGEKTYTCQICATTKTESIAALGHIVVTDNVVDADCEHDGLSEGTHCGRCMITLQEQQVVPKKGHDWIITKEEAGKNCKVSARVNYVCSRCGIEKVQALKEKGPHRYVTDPGVKPDCTHEGLTDGKHCIICGKVAVKQKKIPARGHDFGKAYWNDLTYQTKCRWCNDISVLKSYKQFNSRDIGISIEGVDENKKMPALDKIVLGSYVDKNDRLNIMYNNQNVANYIGNVTAVSYDRFIHSITFKSDSQTSSGTMEYTTDEKVRQVGIDVHGNSVEKYIGELVITENKEISELQKIYLQGDTLIVETKNKGKLAIEGDHAQYELGDIDVSKANKLDLELKDDTKNGDSKIVVSAGYIKSEAVTEEKNDKDTQSDVQGKETQTEDRPKTNENNEMKDPVQIVFGTKMVDNAEKEKEQNDEQQIIQKIEEEPVLIERFNDQPTQTIIEFKDPPQEEVKEEEEQAPPVIRVSFQFEELMNAVDHEHKFKSKDENRHVCKKGGGCTLACSHDYKGDKCTTCKYKHKKHKWTIVREESGSYDACTVCNKTETHSYEYYKGACMCKRCTLLKAHNYKSDGKKNCKCRDCGHKEKHDYVDGVCKRCGRKK